MITAMDDAIGDIIESLKATGRFDNTIFLFSSDVGTSLKTFTLTKVF